MILIYAFATKRGEKMDYWEEMEKRNAGKSHIWEAVVLTIIMAAALAAVYFGIQWVNNHQEQIMQIEQMIQEEQAAQEQQAGERRNTCSGNTCSGESGNRELCYGNSCSGSARSRTACLRRTGCGTAGE